MDWDLNPTCKYKSFLHSRWYGISLMMA